MERKLVTIVFALFAAASTWAYDFKAGDLYYNITDESAKTVAVTYEDYYSSNNYTSLSGAVTIPETVSYNSTTYSVTSIGGEAFKGCSVLTQVTIPNSVTSIGNSAFRRCSALTQVTIPNSVTSIGNEVFYSCSALTQVTIGNSVTSIGSSAFEYCLALASVRCEATTPPTLGSNCFYNTSIILVFIPTGTKDAYTAAWGSSYTYVEGEGVELTVHVETPGGLTEAIVAKDYIPAAVNRLTVTGTLNETDFSIIKNNMTSLYDLDISGITNTTLSEAVFSGKKTLLQIDLPTQLTAIPANAFQSCPISSITIPNSVTSIGDDAFSDCSKLTQVNIPNSVTSIGNSAFRRCSALTQVSIPNSVTSIGGWAFYDCSALTQVTIPNSVTSIGGLVFRNCSALTSVIIGNHVEAISYDAFGECTSLDTITCLGGNPPAVSQSFETINPKICKLYVPKTALVDYIQDTVWGAFSNMKGIDVPTETYMLNLRIGQGGSISHNGNVYTANSAIEVQPEATTTLQIQATPGYEIGSVIFNGTDYTAQVSEDGTLTLPALTANATLQVSFTQQSYTVAYYFVGSNGYFFTTVNYGETFRCHAAAAEGKNIVSITLNGTDITGRLGADGLLQIENITEDCTLIISTDAGQATEVGDTRQDASFRTWQSNGEVFVEHTQGMTGVALYDANGRLLHQTETNGYGVLRMAAPGKIHIVRATYADGTTASRKVM